jgi:hypothetical protein
MSVGGLCPFGQIADAPYGNGAMLKEHCFGVKPIDVPE